jgi:predicted tellurium resistance membrane protein TerC
MDWNIAPLLSDPAAWAALITLIVMEVVLGIDNLIFISILTNKLPESQRPRAGHAPRAAFDHRLHRRPHRAAV